MTSRLITLPTHAVLELLGGFAMLIAPFLLGFDPAAAIVAVFAGALIVGIALAASGEGRGALGVSTHREIDRAIALGLVSTSLILALAGDAIAALTLLGAALAQTALNLSTRYTRAF